LNITTNRKAAHWLAVEGVQPSIPQNPTTAEARAQELVPKGPSANSSLAAMTGNDNATFKPQVKHVMSKELMLYFDKILSAILDEDPDEEVVRLREAALASVRDEPGLHQLVPYFVQFIADKVTQNGKNTFVLRQAMELTSSMISNKSLFIDPYAISICAPAVTCLLGRRIGPDSPDEVANQYQLREFCASLIGLIANKYTKSSKLLKPRLARTFLKHFLDPTKPLPVHYGAISGLTAVGGREAVYTLILPNLKSYEVVLIKAVNDNGGNITIDVEMVISSIMKAIGLCGGDPPMTNGTSMHHDISSELVDYLGPTIGSRVSALKDVGLKNTILNSGRR
jgi:transcription initiation factor TFIID subunit 6